MTVETGDFSEPVAVDGGPLAGREGISAVGFSPGGAYLAAAAKDSMIYLWEVNPNGHLSGKKPLALPGGEAAKSRRTDSSSCDPGAG